MDIFEERNDSIVLSLGNITKSGLGELAHRVSSSVTNGEEDALDVYIKAKALSEIADAIMSDVKEEAVSEAGNYSTNDSSKLGCKFQIKETPNAYSFEHNEEWVHLNNQIETLKKAQKEIEKQMIEAMKYSELISKDGEVIPPAIIKRYGGTTLAISIPK